VCISLCTTVVHNTVQNISDYFPPNLRTVITALTTSIEGEGGSWWTCLDSLSYYYEMVTERLIHGQLPAPIINGRGDEFWKWKNFQLSMARDLDLDFGSGHTAYRCASLIDLYLHSKFHSNRRFLVDGCTYVRTFETHFIRLTQKSRPKKLQQQQTLTTIR